MQIVAFISGKGGVGKSTLTANVAAGLVARKKRVLVIDLDPQNVQRIHLGLDPNEIAGLAREGLSMGTVFESPFGIQFVPFGQVRDAELEEFEAYLRAHPTWLRDSLASFEPDAYDYVIIDTPPGPTVYMQQVLRAVHRVLIVAQADAASLATIPRTVSLVQELTAGRDDFVDHHIVINQMVNGSKLSHQVRKTLQQQYADILVPVVVQRDAAVSQALAFERPALQYEPGSPASQSLQGVADWLIDSSDD